MESSRTSPHRTRSRDQSLRAARGQSQLRRHRAPCRAAKAGGEVPSRPPASYSNLDGFSAFPGTRQERLDYLGEKFVHLLRCAPNESIRVSRVIDIFAAQAEGGIVSETGEQPA